MALKGLSPTEYLKAQYEKRSRLLERYAQKQKHRTMAEGNDANLRTFIQDITPDEGCETEEEAAAFPQESKSVSPSSCKLNSKVMSTNINIKVNMPPKVWNKVFNQLSKYSCNTEADDEYKDMPDSDDNSDEWTECSKRGFNDGQNNWQAKHNSSAKFGRKSKSLMLQISAEHKESVTNGECESGDWQVNTHQSVLKETKGFVVYKQQNDNNLQNFSQGNLKTVEVKPAFMNINNVLLKDRRYSEIDSKDLQDVRKDIYDKETQIPEHINYLQCLNASNKQDLSNVFNESKHNSKIQRNVSQAKQGYGRQIDKENQVPGQLNFLHYENVSNKLDKNFEFCNRMYKNSNTPCCHFHNDYSLILLKALQEIGQPASPQELIDYITKISNVQASIVFQVVHTVLNWAENACFLRRIGDFYYINYKDLFDLNSQLFYQLNQPENATELCKLSGFIGGQQFPAADCYGLGSSCKKKKKKSRKRSKKQFNKKKKSKKVISQPPPKRFLLY